MKKYESPKAEFVEFGTGRINTTSSICNCYAERWDFDEHDLNESGGCSLESRDFSEVGDSGVLD